jgi:hypothetical protein
VKKTVRRTIRRSGNGIDVVADVNAVVATNGDTASSSTTTTVTQSSPRTRGKS